MLSWGVYESAKDDMRVVKRLYVGRRKDLIVVEKSFTTVYSIVLRFHLIV